MMHRFCVCLLMMVMLTLVGCGSKEIPKTYPVKGQVTLEGAPLEGATIMLQPVEGGSFGYGVSDADGLFVISTFELSDGAIPGEHRVVVTKRVAEAELAPGSVGGEQDSNTNIPTTKIEDFQAVPKRYSNAETSGLKVMVDENLESLELKLSSVE